MYPTEGDFANVFESYVHKDDDISMSKVVLTDGDGNTTTLNNVIGNKADKTDLTEITNRLTTAENDIDTAEDNIAGQETRIQGLEAFKERVRAFLEDADASEETINRWHEIESFLQGITDTQTLTGLLNDLKQEILQSIPQSQQGNYLQLIDDLDAYTDAPVGTIVKYTGPTNNKYTHGFDYERVQGEPFIAIGDRMLTLDEDWHDIPSGSIFKHTGTKDVLFAQSTRTYVFTGASIPSVGDTCIAATGAPSCAYEILSVNQTDTTYDCTLKVTAVSLGRELPNVSVSFSKEPETIDLWENIEGRTISVLTTATNWEGSYNNVLDYDQMIIGSTTTTASTASQPIGVQSSWCLIPSMPVIQ